MNYRKLGYLLMTLVKTSEYIQRSAGKRVQPEDYSDVFMLT